jgi:hypothetical protein
MRTHTLQRESGQEPDPRITPSTWVYACLGDPHAPVWFLAENPSVTQIKRVTRLDAESQWAVSRGDLLFRDVLYRNGFKTGESPTSPGGASSTSSPLAWGRGARDVGTATRRRRGGTRCSHRRLGRRGSDVRNPVREPGRPGDKLAKA